MQIKLIFIKKGFAFRLVLKVRVFGTRKWPVPRIFTGKQRKCKEFSTQTNLGGIKISTSDVIYAYGLLWGYS